MESRGRAGRGGRGQRARGEGRSALLPGLITLAGRLGLAASVALAGCSSSAPQDPPNTPASEAVSPPEAAPKEGSTQVASPAGSPAPQPEEGAKREAMVAGDPASEGRREVSPNVAAECSRLTDVMNREAPRMIPKGAANEVAVMTSIAKEAAATADAIAKVKLSTPELVTFRDRIVATVRKVGQAAGDVAKAMQAGDSNAAKSALKEVGDSARMTTTIAEELHNYCKGEQPAR